MTDILSIRQYVIDQIKDLLPKTWVFQPAGNTPEVVTKPTVVLTIQTVERNKANPMGARLVSYTLTLIEPTLDPSKASEALDDKLLALLDALDEAVRTKSSAIVWESASRGLSNGNIGYDISIQVPYNTTQED
jgi:hypothetical protein